MKRMESRIALTFAIMFVVGVIVNGLYSVISKGEGFFTWGMMANALIYALSYLGWIWLHTRRHKLLASLGALSICFMILFIAFDAEGGIAATYSSFDWRSIFTMIYCIATSCLADYQGKELLEEDRKNIKIKIKYKGEQQLNPEDFEVSVD